MSAEHEILEVAKLARLPIPTSSNGTSHGEVEPEEAMIGLYDLSGPTQEELLLEELRIEELAIDPLDDITLQRLIDSDDEVGLYLREAGRVPLLTEDEEISLAKRMETGLEAKAQLAALLENGTDSINTDTISEKTQFIEDGENARDYLVRANTRLVVSIAKKYMDQGVPFLDLIQDGNVGLLRATDKFDYKRGFRFSTYATWWIRQGVTRGIADHGRTIRVPVHEGDIVRQIYKIGKALDEELGRMPTDDEVIAKAAEVMGLAPNQVKDKLDKYRKTNATTFEAMEASQDDSTRSWEDYIDLDGSELPQESAARSQLKDIFEEVLTELTEREVVTL